MSGLTGAVMTSGRQMVVDWSVVMSPSSPWTETRGRAAAAAIVLEGKRVWDRGIASGFLTKYIVNG